MCKWKFTILPSSTTLKRRVELKERKILEILKNHFGQFHKLNNDIVNFILLAMVFQTYVQFHFYYHIRDYYIVVQ